MRWLSRWKQLNLTASSCVGAAPAKSDEASTCKRDALQRSAQKMSKDRAWYLDASGAGHRGRERRRPRANLCRQAQEACRTAQCAAGGSPGTRESDVFVSSWAVPQRNAVTHRRADPRRGLIYPGTRPFTAFARAA